MEKKQSNRKKSLKIKNIKRKSPGSIVKTQRNTLFEKTHDLIFTYRSSRLR